MFSGSNQENNRLLHVPSQIINTQIINNFATLVSTQ